MSSPESVQKIKQEIPDEDLNNESLQVKTYLINPLFRSESKERDEKLKILTDQLEKQQHDMDVERTQFQDHIRQLKTQKSEKDKQIIMLYSENSRKDAYSKELLTNNQQLLASYQQLSIEHRTVVAENAQLKIQLAKFSDQKNSSNKKDDSVKDMEWSPIPVEEQIAKNLFKVN